MHLLFQPLILQAASIFFLMSLRCSEPSSEQYIIALRNMFDLNDKHIIGSKCSSLDELERGHADSKAQKHTGPPAGQQVKQIIRLGVCAMRKKIEAKPMQEILHRLACKYFEIVLIDDEYWDKEEKTWPRVDALICFYSDGFPYIKAWRYVQQTHPFLINDLDKQQVLWDRTLVYSELRKYNVPTPKHYFVCRDRESTRSFYKRRNSDIDEFSEPDITYSPRSISPTHNLSGELSLARISEKYEDDDECSEKCQADKTGTDKSSGSPEELSPGLGLKRSKNSFYNSVNQENENEGDEVFKNNHHELETQSPSIRLSKRKQESYRGVSRAQTLICDIPTRNPVQFLSSYFKALTYEEYTISQSDDCLFIGNIKLKKPFVEKPFDAQNHEVCIYYPARDGGGRKQLFRKKQNYCSMYEPSINNVRTDGNYIYEQFVRTNGFDIKVYTVGPYYMHAEARKSPGLDGVVQRNEMGKEKRYPVFLTPQEKFIAQKVVQIFGQYVCGFDLLRSDGKSYVCDVNGWSFVKGNHKYYDDCAAILKKLIFEKFFPTRVKEINNFSEYGNFNSYIPNQFRPPEEQVEERPMELRSIVAIFRHGDRNPKQKMKFTTCDPRFLSFLGESTKEVKIKDPKTMTQLLNITNQLLSEKSEVNDTFLKLVQLKSVLEIGGHFEGLNRKVQLKPIEISTDQNDPAKKKVTNIVLILKWGGELTRLGEADAIELGKIFRLTKYSHDEGLISLHSSYRHDLKTYSSDEGRCLKTAAAFLKGFLNLEGDLPPIINTMINRESRAQRLLDCITPDEDHGELKELQTEEKNYLSQMYNREGLLEESLTEHVSINSLPQEMQGIVRKIGNPRTKLHFLLSCIKQLTSSIAEEVSVKESSYYINSQDVQSSSIETKGNKEGPESESLVLVYKRWYKLQKDLYDSKSDRYNISKIPDIYDSIAYDMLHNRSIIEKMYSRCNELYEVARDLAYFIVPNEYGIKDQHKLETARHIVEPLCRKIYSDLMFWKGKKSPEEEEFWKYKGKDNNNKEWRHVRTRLYFTSSSHIYSIFNFLTLGNDGELMRNLAADIRQKIRDCIYLGYLAHIDLRLYENLNSETNDPRRFRLELTLSPSFSTANPLSCRSYNFGQNGFTIEEIETYFKNVLGQESAAEDKKIQE